jgi:hypothetical protein
LGTTFIDAHLAEIKDIAGDILRAYPMLLALVLFGTCALLYSQGATTPLIIPLAVALGVPTWAILASYVAVTGVFVLPTYPTSGGNGVRHHRDNTRGQVCLKPSVYAARTGWDHCWRCLWFYHRANDCLNRFTLSIFRQQLIDKKGAEKSLPLMSALNHAAFATTSSSGRFSTA